MWVILGVFSIICSANAGILIWGSQEIQIPSLKIFNDEDFELLQAYMRHPKVLAFRGNPMEMSDDLQELLRNKYTAYVPNTNLQLNNIIDLDRDPASNLNTIKQKLYENEGNNVLTLFLSSNNRLKRDVESDGNETTLAAQKEDIIENDSGDIEPPSGAILYNADGKAMIYTSKPPVLLINNSKLLLGKQVFATIDNRGKYTRLNVGVRVQGGKVTLRFKFVWTSGYWSLPSVEVVDIESKTSMLNVTESVTPVSRNFSYHCGGEKVFTDMDNEIELKLFDLQVQPDTVDGRFSDALNCIPFTTGPIWSGIFVTAILLLVLMFGLLSLNSIKTMDKFDNAKTKQLTITTSE